MAGAVAPALALFLLTFQTVLLPDLVHTNFFPATVLLTPGLAHTAPALMAPVAGKALKLISSSKLRAAAPDRVNR